MNILILANHLNYGGISAYIINLCQALHRQEGIRIYVGSRGGDLQQEIVRLGLMHIPLPLTTKCEVSLKVFLSFLKLKKIARHLKFDIIHANTRVTQVLAELLSRSEGIPFISTCHGYFKRRLSRRFFPCWGCKVIAISDQVRDHLIDDFHLDPNHIELIYNGVDLEKFHSYSLEEIKSEKNRLGLDPDKKIVGHIGRLSLVKGQRFLIMAAEKLIQKRNDLQFLIMGEGEQEGALRQLIHQKRLEKVVLIKPSVSNTALALATMDIFVMPSIQEGLGISVLEAQAEGVPVVASRVGGLTTIVRDGVTGLFFETGNVDSLVSAIIRFLETPVLKNTVVANAKRQVQEKFSLETMAQKTRHLYETLVC